MDEEEQSFPIYRTDGFWYMNAYKVLSKFTNRLKINDS